MRCKSVLILISLLFVLTTALCSAAVPPGYVSVSDFEQFAKDRGTENEDWQPAFQNALEACGEKGATLFVPCGVYKIRKAIQVPQPEYCSPS